MINFILVTAYACSVIAATLTLIEWFLSEQQKRLIEDRAVIAWNRIDDLNRQRILPNFRSGTPQLVLGLLSLTVSVWFMSSNYVELRTSDPELFWTLVVSLFISVGVIVKWVLPGMLNYLKTSSAQESYSMSLFRLWFGTTVVYIFLFFVLQGAFQNETGAIRMIGIFLDTLLTTGRNTVIALVYLTILANISLIRKPLVSGGELVMRRMAESSKGPLLAIAGLATAVATFLKLFVAD